MRRLWTTWLALDGENAGIGAYNSPHRPPTSLSLSLSLPTSKELTTAQYDALYALDALIVASQD